MRSCRMLKLRWLVQTLGLVGCALAASAVALEAAEEKGSALPLRRVVLFNSGVGFFEHAGQVQGNAKIEMRFNVRDINDLLKSMVVQDFDGGQVSTVTYGSKDPITKTLKTFAVDLTANPTLAQLLTQVRGEKVEIDAPNKILGVILGVETRKKKIAENETIDVDVLNLLTDDGLRAVPMESVGRIRLVNESLDAELRKALLLLASSHATDKKAVSLSFLGDGKRRVSMGYIQETPVWKTTYRLVLDDKGPLLQGWAIVENTSEQDWGDVNLTLVSGRPISFVMDLYDPLYVPRPTVELELYASLRPQTYGQDLAKREGEFLAAAAPPAPAMVAAAKAAPSMAMRRAEKQGAGMITMNRVAAGEPADEQSLRFDPSRGVKSAAEAANVGEFFQYKIANAVSLPRQQSAMLPIVNESVKGDKVSIYNPAVHAKHPLSGLRFTNSTKLHLMQGPITVFDGEAYAGDAKIEDIPPGSQRLISYAMDLSTEVAPQSKGRPEELLSVKIIKGTMLATRKYVRGQEYTVKNSAAKPKTVLIEYPLDPNWKLATPKEATEKTRDLYRFAVEAKPGVPVKFEVEEERMETQSLAINNIDDGTIQFYLGAKIVSDKVKAALGEVVKRKQEIQAVTVKRNQVQQRIQQIEQDQARIRQNMAQLDRTSDVYKNYVKKFSDQEGEIEKLRGETVELTSQETALRKALDDYLIGLQID